MKTYLSETGMRFPSKSLSKYFVDHPLKVEDGLIVSYMGDDLEGNPHFRIGNAGSVRYNWRENTTTYSSLMEYVIVKLSVTYSNGKRKVSLLGKVKLRGLTDEEADALLKRVSSRGYGWMIDAVLEAEKRFEEERKKKREEKRKERSKMIDDPIRSDDPF